MIGILLADFIYIKISLTLAFHSTPLINNQWLRSILKVQRIVRALDLL